MDLLFHFTGRTLMVSREINKDGLTHPVLGAVSWSLMCILLPLLFSNSPQNARASLVQPNKPARRRKYV